MHSSDPHQRPYHVYGTLNRKTSFEATEFLRSNQRLAALLPAATRLASLRQGVARVLPAQWADGQVQYTTIERVVGTVAGRAGSFLLRGEGTVRDKHNQGAWVVLAGSATGDLHGLRGEGGFEAEHGKHGAWTLNYWFE